MSALASFLIVSAILAFNLARLLERWGYSKKDIVHLPEILDENSENVNFLKAVRESVHYHFTFWGVYVTVSPVYGPVKSALFVISIVAKVILLSPLMLPFFVLVVGIPAFLYFASKGELNKVMGLFAWIFWVSLASLVLLGILRFVALHASVPRGYSDFGTFRGPLLLVEDYPIFRGLFLLSTLGVLSGISGYLGTRYGNLSLLALLVIGIVSVFVDVRLLGVLVVIEW
ncbi:hypothetical protein [Thermococcus sp. 21S9]|uniref:hypothetical protein n=1 Tax=Thermococcus sp. 21S9 TaxID=1638223 RepID=UPI00143B65EC|nr:hypothetical protein [Thermococcus sp. 21S9]NJE54380.1 hypothetical protein [Thermococcus sp. 21S9]